MHKLQQIKETARKQQSAFKTMQAIVEKMNKDIDAERLDKSRTPQYVNERVQMIREQRTPAVSGQYEQILAINKELQNQEKYWLLKPLVLSLFTFDEDRARDAAIRGNVGRELSAMPAKVLNLACQSAVENKDFPKLYQCYLAVHSRADETQKSGLDIDFNAVEIPEQLQALSEIADAAVREKDAENLMVDSLGLRPSPYQRLNAANQRADIDNTATARRKAMAAAAEPGI